MNSAKFFWISYKYPWKQNKAVDAQIFHNNYNTKKFEQMIIMSTQVS